MRVDDSVKASSETRANAMHTVGLVSPSMVQWIEWLQTNDAKSGAARCTLTGLFVARPRITAHQQLTRRPLSLDKDTSPFHVVDALLDRLHELSRPLVTLNVFSKVFYFILFFVIVLNIKIDKVGLCFQ